MATSYPGSLDALVNPLASDLQSVVEHDDQHTNANDAIEAIQATLGINPLTRFAVTTKGDVLVATGNATVSRLGVGSNNQVIMADSATGTGIKWATLSFEASGTVSTHAASTSDPHSAATYAMMPNGGRRIFTSTTTPTGTIVDGDLWFQPE